jgi:tetratricopeptide (TPR) repeat protein
VKVGYAQDADSLYRIEDYQGAAAGYEAVLADGFASADLYYNLGNTYYRLERYGLAILNYERALRLNPGMDDAEQNLALANSKTADRITILPKLFVVRWFDSLVRIHPSTWRVVTLIMLALFAAAVACFLLARSLSMRKNTFAAGVVFLVLLLVTVLFLVFSTRHFNARSEAIVVEGAISVKSSPEQQSVDKLVLHEGAKVTITETLPGWKRITLADGTTGWCQDGDVERI